MAHIDPDTPSHVWIAIRNRVAREVARCGIPPREAPSIYDMQYAEALLAAGYIDVPAVALELAAENA